MHFLPLLLAAASTVLASPAISTPPTTLAMRDDNSNHFTNYTIFDLPYSSDALQPVISKETNDAHLTLLAGAVKSLNTASAALYNLLTTSSSISLADTLTLNTLSNTVLSSTGAIQTHFIYFSSLAPLSGNGGKTEKASPDLTAEVVGAFGDWEKLKKAMDKSANDVPASGWAWLVWDVKIKTLDTTYTLNKELLPSHLYPILNIDLFEHAYYLDTPADKAAYLKNVKSLFNYEFASSQLEKAKNMPSA